MKGTKITETDERGTGLEDRVGNPGYNNTKSAFADCTSASSRDAPYGASDAPIARGPRGRRRGESAKADFVSL